MRQGLFVLLMSLGVTAPTLAAPRAPLTVTYFNIAWFGLGGSPSGSTSTERRAPTIRKFFDDNQLWADVMAFEEIVNVEMLKRDVLQNRYECQSYDHRDSKHQHVVVCNKNELSFVKAADDDNFTLEDVAMSNLRPAVHGILKDANGRRLLHVVGVHLKAMPEKSDVRREQVGMISDYLTEREDGEPILVIGDYNSFNDDPEAFADLFGREMRQVPIRAEYTFNDTRYKNKFDLAWASSSLEGMITERVVGPCNSTSRADIEKFNREVSDHCPVNLTLRLPNR